MYEICSEDIFCSRCGNHFLEVLDGGECWTMYRCKNCGRQWREDYSSNGTKITELD